MDAAQALADLTEISSQIESALLAGGDGTVLASTFEAGERAGGVAEAALELLREAETTAATSEALVQVQVATQEGCFFVVRDDRNVVAAVTGAEPTVGLVFYDLKTCLRLVAEEPEEPKKAPRRRRKKAEAAVEADDGQE
jgi:predicted regulator of Ras-like GTPase activity (Roadblock/LC7/MglB family)